MPQLERFHNIWKFIYSYVQDIEISVSSTFCAICDSLKLCKVHYFGKRWFLSWNISSWCMPQLERFFIIWQVFLAICTRHKAFGFSDCFALSATLLCLVPSIFWKKMIFFSWNISSWWMPQLERFLNYMKGFLFICTRHRVRYLQFFSLSATP